MPQNLAIQIATAAAQGFKNLECVACANKVIAALVAAGEKAELIELRTVLPNMNIACESDGFAAAISENGPQQRKRSDMTPNALQLLEQIRRKPGMFLARPSIRELANFLYGYQMGLHDCGTSIDDRFSRDFQQWVQRKFNVQLTGRWDSIIEFHTGGVDAAAMKYFWELLDEFFATPETSESTAADSESQPAGVRSGLPIIGRTV